MVVHVECIREFFFFSHKPAFEVALCLVGSEVCIRDRSTYSVKRNPVDIATGLRFTLEVDGLPPDAFAVVSFHLNQSLSSLFSPVSYTQLTRLTNSPV